MHIFRDFFWFCSGANSSILKRCPTESSKYTGIGATVFFTGLFAGISASFALFTVFQNPWVAIAFGFVWGSMIFNLDRFIVSSMRKRKSFFKEIGMAIPRLILAILLALVISKPLELKIFEKEILRVIDAQKVEQAFETKEAVFQNYPEIEERQNSIAQLRQEIREKEEFRNTKQEEYDLERFGIESRSTSGIPGIGRNARIKEQQLNDAQNELEMTRNRNNQQIQLFENQILELYAQRDEAINSQKATIDNYDGFAARIDALSALTAESRAIFLANLFIILLFIAVETAPIVTKIISPRGPYDDILEKHEHVFAKQRIREVTKLEQETFESLHLLEENSKSHMRRELDVNRTTFREMTDAEIEIARKTIHHWKEMEMEKIKDALLEHNKEANNDQVTQVEEENLVSENRGNDFTESSFENNEDNKPAIT
jgi:hypothetical protein